MSHVVLIRGPVLFPSFRPSGWARPVQPLGVAYLAGAASSAGHKVTCIDGAGEGLDQFRICPLDSRLLENGITMEEIVNRIPASADVIGLSCMFSLDWFYMIELIKKIRRRFPSTFLVVGGEHVTADYEYVLKTMPEVDACILGEGENKLVGLLNSLDEGIPKTKLPGVAFFDPVTGKVRKNSEKDGEYRITDINSIPRPAWHLVPIDKYLDSGHGFNSAKSRVMPLLASRGCPHQCTFCSSAQMWTTRWKSRDVGDVLDEIKDYIRRYNIDRIEFFDLTTVIDKKWIIEFCRRLIDENLGITWGIPSGTRTEALTQEVLELIKESGNNKLTYPLETGNEKVNQLIKKKINYKHSLTSMRNAVKAGIIVKTSIIIGFPFTRLRDVFTEYLFAIRMAWIGASDVTFYNFSPYPGSELHDQLVSEGKIVKDATYPDFLRRTFPANYTDGLSWTPHISGPVLRFLCVFGIALFYAFQYLFRPHRLVLTLFRILTGKPVTLIELGVTGAVARFLRRNRLRLELSQPT